MKLQSPLQLGDLIMDAPHTGARLETQHAEIELVHP